MSDAGSSPDRHITRVCCSPKDTSHVALKSGVVSSFKEVPGLRVDAGRRAPWMDSGERDREIVCADTFEFARSDLAVIQILVPTAPRR